MPTLRPRLRHLLRRHRRPVAALLAGVGALLLVGSMRQGTAPVVPTGGPTLHSGEVAVPVQLASPAIAATLSTGDIVDLVGLDADSSSIVAHDARVLSPAGAGGFGSAASAVVLLAVDESSSLDVSTAVAAGPVSVLIRSAAPAR